MAKKPVAKKAVKKPAAKKPAAKKVVKKTAAKKPAAKKVVKKPAPKKAVAKKSASKLEKKNSKKLVIFYSLTGCTKVLAEALANKIKADLLELDFKKPMNLKGFFKYAVLGFQSGFGLKPAIKRIDKNLINYDMIFIGSPVWAGTYASPFNTFLANYNISGKKIALFSSYAGSAGKLFESLKKKLEGNQIIAEKGFKDFFYHKSSSKDAKEAIASWGEAVAKK